MARDQWPAGRLDLLLAYLAVRVRGYVGVRSWQVGAVERAAKSRVLRLEALPRSLPYGI